MEEQKEIIADLHIHSRFSRACSKSITIPYLAKWARVKGLNLLGTGDFQHPEWFKELDVLEEGEGIIYYEGFPFLWQTEISLMYTKDGKGRRIHYVILAPNKEVVKQITKFFGSKGRLDYDGRPIFGFSSIELVEAMENIDKDIEIIPAHVWTPWFGIFGSRSGFNSLKEAFEDKADRIHAIETGMSSDPEMNWRIKGLNKKSIVSFSDSHSFWPWRIGREATIFLGELSYKNILKQIRENSFKATVETDPGYGIYHWDGHRDCNFSCSPNKSKEINNICPVCNKSLTIGVENRVEQLADNPLGFMPQNAKPYYKILPLHELIALAKASTLASKKTWQVYNSLIEKFGNEFNILLFVDKTELAKFLPNDALLVELIIKNRIGNIKVKPGYDGVYGEALMPEKQVKLF
ncbi:MAG: endonuclease Q family protein [Candidatus Nanoarchaeia archaeon]|nr:endonuclease Q family protein [Candidatus Nanoarchaeia archaeon]MDD5741183.1 endonuclease Q family protein [Candidatus Nanoarchaeia archaeon]